MSPLMPMLYAKPNEWTWGPARRNWRCDYCTELIKKGDPVYIRSETDEFTGRYTWRRHPACSKKPL